MNEKLTWRQRTVCRILLFVAQIIAGDDEDLFKELDKISNHICHSPED